MASLTGYIGRVLSRDRSILRILTLIGMSAGLSGFFGLPLGGGIFVLEVIAVISKLFSTSRNKKKKKTSHRMGLQYSEAISTTILASIISAFVVKAIKRENLGGQYQFPDTGELHAIHFVEAAGIGCIGAIVAFLFTICVHKLKKVKARLNLNPVFLAFLGTFPRYFVFFYFYAGSI